jgi:hypothetical protein
MNTKTGTQVLSAQPSARRLSARALVLVALVALACGEAFGQDSDTKKQQDDVSAPPPMRYLPDDVRQKLDGVRDPKERTRLSIELAEERLARVAEQSDAERYESATGELGIYEAIVADAVRYLQMQNKGRASGKLRDLCKHLDIALREHIPRLETIRRGLPSQHAVYLREAIEFVREQRDDALNAFYSDTVLAEPRQQKDKPPLGERAKGDAPAAPESAKKPEQE